MMTTPHRRFAFILSSLVLAGLLLSGDSLLALQPLNFLSKKKDKTEARFKTELLPATAEPGDEVTLQVTATIPKGFHIYSTTQKALGAQPTEITVKRQVGVESVESAFTSDREADTSAGPEKVTLETFHDKVVWSRKFKLKSDAKRADVEVEGTIKYMICTTPKEGEEGGVCIPGGPLPFVARLVRTSEAEQGAAEPKSEAAEPATGAKAAAPASVYEHRQGKDKGPILVTWKATVQPRQVKPGDTVTLTIQAEVKPDWHTYSPNQQLLNDEGPQKTGIKFTEIGDLKPVGPFKGTKPQPHDSEAWKGLKELYLEGKSQWVRKYTVPEDAKPGEIPINGGVSYQVCKSGSCVNHGVAFTGSVTVADKTIDEPVGLKGTIAKPQAQFLEEPDPVDDDSAPALAPPAKGDAPRRAEGGPQDIRANGFLPFMMVCIAGGFAALLTPCVFPMVPITVSFFHKQAENKHSSPLMMALVYSLSIVAAFTGLGMAVSILFGASALNLLANLWWFNVGMGLILIVFACNMLGMFDIVVPSWLLSLTSGQESRGGYVGIVFMALTFTLTSFTCTFAVLGTLLSMAASGDRLWPVFGLLGFSTAFALPFFLLALFPSMLRSLPQTGGWMNAVKVVMGILEIGAAFKFLSMADVAWFGRPYLLDFELVVSAWMVLSVVAGMYLLGMFRTPHDVPVDHIGVPRLVLAMSFFGLGAYIAVGLFAAKKSEGFVWENIVALAPPAIEEQIDDADLGPTVEHAGIKYALDVDKALAMAIKLKRPLFVDITGVNCANCRLMEKGPMSRTAVVAKLQKFVCARVYADIVPGIPDRKLAGEMLERNVKLQNEWFGDSAMPAYVIVTPTEKAFESRASIVAELLGLKLESTFSDFLDAGLHDWNAVRQVAAVPAH